MILPEPSQLLVLVLSLLLPVKTHPVQVHNNNINFVMEENLSEGMHEILAMHALVSRHITSYIKS